MISRFLCWLGVHSRAPICTKSWNEWEGDSLVTKRTFVWPCCEREITDAQTNR